jgi:molybdopterin-containing oxidoreductase family iron-sulfur binding subunit
MRKESGVTIMESDAYYNPEQVPEADKFYMPVACQQCRNPPCVKACPVQATWQEPDGIVVIDYNWCVGCRCCMAACPYGARRFNWSEPHIPEDELNPKMHYLGNRPRPRGVVEKCTFCIQRVRQKKGRYPACVEACPVGARKFGNLLDRDSEISHILREKRVFIFKEDLSTETKFFYFYAT